MSYLLGIRIDGARIKDEDARLICFMIEGLTYLEASDCMDYEVSTVRNHICNLYGCLEVPSEIQCLLAKCKQFGFEEGGRYKNTRVLTRADINRMHRIAPRTDKGKAA